MDLRHLRRPIHLILDWDGTLTRKDTLSLVGQIGYSIHRKSTDNPTSALPPWSDFVTAYGDDFSHHISRYEPKATARTTLDQERQWLASLTPIENRSVRRVETSTLFRGVTAQDINHTVATSLKTQELQLRSHWDILLQNLLNQDDSNKISILSVNWSERFIRQSLLQTSANNPNLNSYIQTMEIRANEITGLDAPGGSDGTLNKKDSNGIRTSADKLANLPPSCRKRLHAKEELASNSNSNEAATVIYIGDSATDLESLLAADVGICIRDEPMGSSQKELADTLHRIGVQTFPIHQGLGVVDKGGVRIIYWASDYEQIVRALGV